MKKSLLTVTLIICLGSFSFSQEIKNDRSKNRNLGFRIGTSVASYKGGQDYDLDYKKNIGFHLAMVYDFKITKHLLLGSGIIVQNRGANYFREYEFPPGFYKKYDWMQSLITLDIPVNIIYALKIKDHGTLKLNIGPYGTYHISGKQRAHDIYNYLPIFNTKAGDRDLVFGNAETNDLKKFGFGANIGVRHLLPNGVGVGLNYFLGMSNLNPSKTHGSFKSRSLAITAEYSL